MHFIFSIVTRLIYKFYYNPTIINIYKKYFSTNNNKMKIIDIGADKGQYLSLFLKNFYFLINRIYAFEPNNQSYNNLKLNFHERRIKFFNYALGARNFKSKMNIGAFDSGHSTLSVINDSSDYFLKKKKIIGKNIYKKKKQIVTIVRLDNFLKVIFPDNNKKIKSSNKFLEEKIGSNCINNALIVKIDVEGYELNVLKGMKNFFKNNLINLIQIEIHFDDMYKNYSHKKVYEFLKKNKFQEIKFLKFPFMPWGDAFFIKK